MTVEFGLGLTSNKETNDFLRCLWARLAASFGEMGWQFMPMRTGNSIFVGFVTFGANLSMQVTLHYKKRGCLSLLEFYVMDCADEDETKRLLGQCVKEAKRHDEFEESVYLKGHLDKNISFSGYKTHDFAVEGNSLILKINGYDRNDRLSILRIQKQHVCDLLTFDTLRYIADSGSLMEEIRDKHNFITRLVNADDDNEADTIEKNEIFRNLEVSEWMADYIKQYLERPYMYEEHFSLFDRSVRFFAQGVRNEELAHVMIGLPEPYIEQAIVNYMSALELITMNDKEPEICECCGQTRYSIARRVRNLTEKALQNGAEFANEFYWNRSKYVHTGMMLSNYSYTQSSIPLMSGMSKSGLIEQVSMVDGSIKDMVKECILWHEKSLKV